MEEHWNSFHQVVEVEPVLPHAPKVVGEHQEVLAPVEEVLLEVYWHCQEMGEQVAEVEEV